MKLRIIKPRDWRIEPADLERAVDRSTKLVALTLVSNTNGFMHDAKAVANLAHAHGAYFYADIIQAAGCVPFDVRASGVDFCAAATYKWLMGLRGFGYLYVREDLHERLKTRRFGDRHYRNFQYENFPAETDFRWSPSPGAAKYEIGSFSDVAVAAQQEALSYLLQTGVEQIQKRVFPMTRWVRREVAKLGYELITPEESPAPIASFLVRDERKAAEKLRRANVNVKVKWGQAASIAVRLQHPARCRPVARSSCLTARASRCPSKSPAAEWDRHGHCSTQHRAHDTEHIPA